MTSRLSEKRSEIERPAFGRALAFACALAMGGAVALADGSAQAQTLDEALAAAYTGNPALLGQRAALRATNEGVAQALSGWRPTVTLSGSQAMSRTDSNARSAGAKPVQTLHPHGAELSVSQSLFNGFRTLSSIDKAEHEVMAGRAQLYSREQGVLLSAATAYLNVVRDQAVLELNINNEQVLLRQLEAAQDRFDVGELTRTDVSQAEARLARARADRIQSEGDLTGSRATFEKVVGLVPERLVAPPIPSGLPATKEDALGLAVRDHFDINAARYAEAAARSTVDGVSGELLPSVTLSGGLSRDYETQSKNSRVDAATVRASVSVPLYQGGAVYSRLRAAKQTAAQRRIAVDETTRDVTEAATQAWETLETTQARISSYRAQIAAAEIALEGVQREAQVGSRTVLDVLDAEQELLDAKVSLVRAERDAVVAAFQLRAAVGQLTASALGLPVDIYDPTRHYDEVRGTWFGGSSSGDIDDMDDRGGRAE